MARVEIENLSYNYESTKVLKAISLTIDDGEFFFLLGPSGCGKTTLLRAIAGLGPAPLSGTIRIDGVSVSHLPPWKRSTPLVFQSYALWPHMTVMENVAFGLKMRGTTGVKERVKRVLETVQLEDQAHKRPGELSGGQQQRVALARALVTNPPLLLLDEPLSNLDAKLRHDMRHQLKRIHHETGITFIYVTHDQEEALSLATGIALLNRGRVVQKGAPRDLYYHPRTLFAARFMGATNAIRGSLRERKEKRVLVETPLGILEGVAAHRLITAGYKQGDSVVAIIRPECVRVASGGPHRGTLQGDYFMGPTSERIIEAAGIPFTTFFTGTPNLSSKHPREVTFFLPPEKLVVYPEEEAKP